MIWKSLKTNQLIILIPAVIFGCAMIINYHQYRYFVLPAALLLIALVIFYLAEDDSDEDLN